MPLSSLKPLFQRDLCKLYREIDAYQQESDLWLVEQSISNSAGNLALHLVGNLNAFIGAQLGDTAYERDRDFEFHGKGVPKKELLQQIEATKTLVNDVLDKIEPEQLDQYYPLEVFGNKMTTSFFLIHLLGHLNFHLGQINYHRRLLTKKDVKIESC
jgi:uncharacterized damage-inducible protein DinB